MDDINKMDEQAPVEAEILDETKATPEVKTVSLQSAMGKAKRERRKREKAAGLMVKSGFTIAEASAQLQVSSEDVREWLKVNEVKAEPHYVVAKRLAVSGFDLAGKCLHRLHQMLDSGQVNPNSIPIIFGIAAQRSKELAEIPAPVQEPDWGSIKI